jgi:hypothetical protein
MVILFWKRQLTGQAFATENAIGAPLFLAAQPAFGKLHCRVKPLSRVALHGVRHMAIQVERDPDRCVAEALAGDLGMHPARQQLRRVGVAKIVKTDPRQILHPGHEAGELIREAERLVGLAIRSAADQGLAGLTDPDGKQFFGLLAPKSPELLNGIGGQGDDTVLIRLWRLKADARIRLLEAFHHAHSAALEIDVFPT